MSEHESKEEDALSSTRSLNSILTRSPRTGSTPVVVLLRPSDFRTEWRPLLDTSAEDRPRWWRCHKATVHLDCAASRGQSHVFQVIISSLGGHLHML